MRAGTYFEDKEATDVLYVVLDLVKTWFLKNVAFRNVLYKRLRYIMDFHLDHFNGSEFERFLRDPSYSAKDKILYPSEDGFLIKNLTLVLLLTLYTAFPYYWSVALQELELGDRLLEHEIIKILLCLKQGMMTEQEIFDWFNKYKILTYDDIDIINLKIVRKASLYNRDVLTFRQKSLIGVFFIDFIFRKKPISFSLEELEQRYIESLKNVRALF